MKIKYIILSLFLVLCSFTTSNSEIIYTNDCETEPEYGWSVEMFNGATVALTTDEAYNKTHSWYFEVYAGQARSEIVPGNEQVDPQSIPIGETRWYSFVFKLGDVFPTGQGLTIHQFHTVPDDCEGGWLYPYPTFPLFLARHDGALHYMDLVYIWATSQQCQTVGGVPYGEMTIDYDWVQWSGSSTGLATFNQADWNLVVIKFKPTYQSNGEMVVWLNGDQWVNYTGPSYVNDIVGPYLKMGLYGTGPAKIYYDRIRIGDSNSTYAEMAGDVTPPDTTPPNVSGFSPTGPLNSGTTSTAISWSTDEIAICKWDTSDTTYALMSNTATGGGSTSHSDTLSGLSDDSTTPVYVRCQDDEGTPNVMTTSFIGYVTVDAAGGGAANLFTDVTWVTVDDSQYYTSFGSNQLSADNLHDGDTEETEAGSAGKGSQASIEIQYNLGVPYDLDAFEIWPGIADSWVCTHVTVSIKKLSGDSWTQVWDTDLTGYDSVDLSAYDEYRYIKIVASAPASTQVNEVKLTGTPSAPSQPAITGNNVSIGSGNGSNMTVGSGTNLLIKE